MYKKTDPNQLYLDGYKMQFGGKLRKDNRWVLEAGMIPWDAIEEVYAMGFTTGTGIIAINARIAFGALYIKERQRLTDRETVEYIRENPYAQYFLGLSEFTDEPLFDASMMTHFRKRFSADFINRINGMLFEPETGLPLMNEEKAGQPGEQSPSRTHDEHDNDNDGGSSAPSDGSGSNTTEPKNQGKLLLDATCAPADIRYPNDLSLLNEARENLEQIIDELWPYVDRKGHKTGYSRRKARKQYLSIAKQKQPKQAKTRKVIGNQLQYLRKNIDTVGRLLLQTGIDALPEKWLKRIMTICELYRQQLYMYMNKTHSCENRIVSLRQPHIRPIVRGKSGKRFEFGQKIAATVINGYTFLEHQSYDSFNEGIRLIESVEQYKKRYGCYPEAVLADTIYRNRNNRAYCKQHGIRLSGPRLGRPKAKLSTADKRQMLQDNNGRNAIEGRFGVAKRRYGLGLIMAYLPETGLTEAALQILCMNVSRKMKAMVDFIFLLLHPILFPDFSVEKAFRCA